MEYINKQKINKTLNCKEQKTQSAREPIVFNWFLFSALHALLSAVGKNYRVGLRIFQSFVFPCKTSSCFQSSESLSLMIMFILSQYY